MLWFLFHHDINSHGIDDAWLLESATHWLSKTIPPANEGQMIPYEALPELVVDDFSRTYEKSYSV